MPIVRELQPAADSREPGDLWQRTLDQNLESIKQHRPALYEQLRGAVEIAVLSAPVVSQEEHIAAAFAEVASQRQAGHAIAVAGIGDGSLLRALAKFPASLLLDRQQEVNVIEPDLGCVLAAFGATDLTGPRGPIEQRRFDWHVGPMWEDSLATSLFSQPTKMFPQHTLAGAEPRLDIEEGLSRVDRRLHLRQVAQAEQIAEYYAGIDDDELVSAFSPTPKRKPRVLLLTSQFSTVLQYSTYDSADAFQKLGWETLVLTEAERWHLMSRPAIRATVADFKPDLVFQIDHLRYEMGNELPANLPFVCWIQDHLLNLTCNKAGDSLGARDFVLSGGVYRYVERYRYPRRQCIDMPKVSRPPTIPVSWPCDREDILYVSHWSSSPEQIIVELCKRVGEIGDGASERLMRACAAELTRFYADGGAMRTELEIRGLVRRVAEPYGEPLEPITERFFVDALYQRLNNAFYRQQALIWAGQIADEFGLKFGIYGMGWDKHPELGRFARGVVKYGPDLETLTRQSKILLQLEPYACYTHQRLLDCVLTGGFALIRDHPLNTLPIRIRKFLDAHVPAEVNDVVSARACLDERANAEFDALLADSQVISDVGDLVDVVRGWQRARTIGEGDETLPHLNEINFDTYETLRARVQHFINDRPGRDCVSADQRASVLDRLTYVSALGRAIKTIHERLSVSSGVTPHELASATENA